LERRLAAILIADVVDYSRLMSEDETRTLAALNVLREELFQPKVADANGRIIKRMGDGWIVEFANVSDAVACAIEIQQNLTNHEFIRLRIGVHIGDVVFQEDDIYGDGINIASRLEALAHPGGVAISDTVYNSLDRKAAEQFGGGESHELKNIARPVEVWCWPERNLSPVANKTVVPTGRFGITLVAALALIAVTVVGSYVLWFQRLAKDENSSIAKQAPVVAESENRQALEAVKLGWEFANHTTAASFVAAKEQFARAIKLDPDYARAHVSLAAVYWRAMRNGWHFELDVGFSRAFSLANEHLGKGLRKPIPLGYQLASEIALWRGKHKYAIQMAQKAIEMDTSDPAGHVAFILALASSGDLNAAQQALDDLIKISPQRAITLHRYRGFIEFLQRRYEEAVFSLKQAVAYEPQEEWSYRLLVAAYGHLGERLAAKKAIETVNDFRKQLNRQRLTMIEVGASSLKRQVDIENLRTGWRRAGVPNGRGINASELVMNRLVFYLEDGRFEVKGATTIDVILAKALFDQGVLFVDNRRGLAGGFIKGAKQLVKPTSEKLEAMAAKDQPVVFYCSGFT
jgi:class 3 adenylate cyclase/Tfp pilus assembly protein PilF